MVYNAHFDMLDLYVSTYLKIASKIFLIYTIYKKDVRELMVDDFQS